MLEFLLATAVLTSSKLGLASLLALAFTFAMGMAFTGTEQDYPSFQGPGGKSKTIDGGTIASAVLLIPTGYQQIVSGVVAIVNIQLPYDGFEGTVVLLPTGLFTWTNAGNIALAGSAVVGKALHMTYSQRSAKWYPSYIA